MDISLILSLVNQPLISEDAESITAIRTRVADAPPVVTQNEVFETSSVVIPFDNKTGLVKTNVNTDKPVLK